MVARHTPSLEDQGLLHRYSLIGFASVDIPSSTASRQRGHEVIDFNQAIPDWPACNVCYFDLYPVFTSDGLFLSNMTTMLYSPACPLNLYPSA
jgi:hypothetical protein